MQWTSHKEDFYKLREIHVFIKYSTYVLQSKILQIRMHFSIAVFLSISVKDNVFSMKTGNRWECMKLSITKKPN